MLTRLVALIVFSGALAVLAQDEPKPASYTRGLEQEPIRGRIIAVVDGDTVKVLTAAKQQIRVRLAFVDAPEKGQAFGQHAKQAMSELVFGKDVELHPHSIDRYGRLVAVVYVNGTDAGLELLKEGLCWVYEKYVVQAAAEIQTRYRDAQAERTGLWQDPARP
jgi:endonuclease YncB( thermonuclease family)